MDMLEWKVASHPTTTGAGLGGYAMGTGYLHGLWLVRARLCGRCYIYYYDSLHPWSLDEGGGDHGHKP